jgi:hypothetical protein
MQDIPERSCIVKSFLYFSNALSCSAVMAKKTKNPHAVALGRLGGLKGGKARISKLTPKERTELARKAVQARWAKRKETGKG